MQIQLRQREIEAAIKMYVAQQGISLTGRKVDVTFTAGRKESGLSADVDIQDVEELPELPADEPEAKAAPALKVVAAQPAEAAPAEAQPAKPATSLFN